MSPPREPTWNVTDPTRLICPLTARTISRMRLDMETARAAGADALECRLDYLLPLPSFDEVRSLISDAPLPVIATCRSQRQGGEFAGDEPGRLSILRTALAAGAAFVDVEIDADAGDWPPDRTILSHHDFTGLPSELDTIIERLSASPAAVAKIAFTAKRPEEAFVALDSLGRLGKPAIALAMGEAGLASRVLARKFGAFGTFAALATGAESAPGQPTLDEFRRLYRWDSIGPDTAMFGVIGFPIAHSMSPAIHNAAFGERGVDGVYIPFCVEPSRENFDRFLDHIQARPQLDCHGLSVTIPHKEHALAYVGTEHCDAIAGKIGAINTIAMGSGSLLGFNTDYEAALEALCLTIGISSGDLAGRTVLVLGAGGVSRAIVAALSMCGAKITICNRTDSRAMALAEEFSCQWQPFAAAPDLTAEIVINGTSIGMHPDVATSPLERLPKGVGVVFDTIYNPLQTLLLKQAAAAGCITVSGLEMFVNQAATQFECWTGLPAPRDLMRRTVLNKLDAR